MQTGFLFRGHRLLRKKQCRSESGPSNYYLNLFHHRTTTQRISPYALESGGRVYHRLSMHILLLPVRHKIVRPTWLLTLTSQKPLFTRAIPDRNTWIPYCLLLQTTARTIAHVRWGPFWFKFSIVHRTWFVVAEDSDCWSKPLAASSRLWPRVFLKVIYVTGILPIYYHSASLL